MSKTKTCPKCGCEEFITKPNSYDLYIFEDKTFNFVKTEIAEDEFMLFCRECSTEINIDISEKEKKVTLKTNT